MKGVTVVCGGVKNDLELYIKSIFSISHDGLAIVDEFGDILIYNEIFKKIVLINEEKDMNINDYIKKFRLLNINEIFETYNDVKINVISMKLEDIGTNNYYIISVMEFHNDSLLSKMYESIVCTLSDGIEVIDTNGRLRIYNEGQGKVDGYSPREVVGKHIKDLYKLDEETSLLLKIQKTKKAINNTRQIYYTNKGNKIDVVTSAFPLYFKKSLIGFAAIVRDYTQIQKLIDRNIEIEKKLAENINHSKFSPFYIFGDIITKNKELLDVISFARLASLNDSNVIIYGETGTGKELFAQSIHSASNRKNKPFMALNCAVIPETLLESLLFGTIKGSFTGAVDKAGLFEQADGGTLFLDEINSMPMLLQSKLLRILESKSVTRLGDSKSILVDVRIISSFNQNPMEAVEGGKFRNDLFFRLAVVYLSIPPLRNRMEDIDLLCSHFIEMYNEKLNKNVIDITDDVRRLFNSFDWKGNVRQLKNTIESSMNIIFESCEYIGIEHLPKHILELEKGFIENTINLNSKNIVEIKRKKEISENDISIFDKLKIDEHNEIIKCLNETNGNVAKAAKLMGMSRQNLHYRIKKYNIK